MKRGTVAILSVDGGGVRGVIPAMLIRDILRRVRFLKTWMKRPDDVRVHRLFDIFAGTSTGALLTLGLVQPNPLSPEEIVRFYMEESGSIFPVGRFASVSAMRQAFAHKYDANPFESLLERLFGDARLSECLANTLVTAYDTDNRGPFFFRHVVNGAAARGKDAAITSKEPSDDFLLKDIARSTTAAPTYFIPAQIVSGDGTTYSLVDGGLVANNPALNAYVEARKLYPDARQYLIVSIGTGRSKRHFPFETIRKWGYLDWVSPIHGVPITSMMWDGQSESVAHALKSLPRVEYFRFNADLGEVSAEMDDASEENMRRLERLGRTIIRRESRALHRLARALCRRRPARMRS